ncbi:putative transposase [Citrobacter farmeri]|uniref:DUF6645 domain-containing protein n=1 Tax=Citrobacter farmeri TaxID=67824 RepID=UPI00209DC9B1|nr:DUF6645 domain-containing protein [Citrobacter farmeri]MCP1694710.1 putative transposase [Citrobacter farmeri]MCW2424698.1 putative transposase [Citrobacter farmeri]
MAFKHYDLVSASSGDELQKKLTEKINEGWQPYGSPLVSYDDNGMKIIQAIAAEGDVRIPVETPDDGDDSPVTMTSGAPDYYYVVVLAGQSNGMAYGEGLPLPDSYDRPDSRIKQLARRSTVTPGGKACAYNDIIPADHCLHDVQDMSLPQFSHPRADLTKGQYGTVGQGLHIAKKLLPFIPSNAGILLVPCCRGGSAFTTGADGTFQETSGAAVASLRWGAEKPLYQDLLSRTKAALAKNPKNILLGVVWMQGEGDLVSQNYAQQPALFTAMVQRFRTDLAGMATQCAGGSPASVPWICGDTTYYWKNTYGTQYTAVYGAYKTQAAANIFFVPLMTDDAGANTPTNKPPEDPDIAAAGYYGAASRTRENWTTAQRDSHFSSWARRGLVSDRLATALLQYAGRSLPFLTGQSAPLTPPQTQPGGDTPSTDENIIISYRSGVAEGALTAQGWQASGGAAATVDDSGAAGGKAVRISKTQGGTGVWKMTHPATAADAAALLARGGEIAFRFRIPDESTLVANRFALALYWPVSALPAGVTPEGDTGSDMLAAFFIQSDAANLNLMYHKVQNQKLGTFGAFDHDWHSVAFRFAGNNSISVVPVIDGVEQTAFNLAKCPATGFTADTLLITDITSQETYPVLTDSISVEVNPATA